MTTNKLTADALTNAATSAVAKLESGAKLHARNVCNDYVHVFAERNRGCEHISARHYTVYPTADGGIHVTGGALV